VVGSSSIAMIVYFSSLLNNEPISQICLNKIVAMHMLSLLYHIVLSKVHNSSLITWSKMIPNSCSSIQVLKSLSLFEPLSQCPSNPHPKFSNRLVQHFIAAPFHHNLYSHRHPIPLTRDRAHILDLAKRDDHLWQSSH